MKILISILKFIGFIVSLLFFIFILIVWISYAVKPGKLDILLKTGPIGDTIGGLTAPIIGLLGSILIFYSFQAQLKANKLQIKALKQDRKKYNAEKWFHLQNENFNSIKRELQEIEIQIPTTEDGQLINSNFLVFKGIGAVSMILFDSDIRPEQSESKIANIMNVLFLGNLKYILIQFQHLTSDVLKNRPKYKSESIILLDSIKLYYYTFLEDLIKELIKRSSADDAIEFEEVKNIIDNNFKSLDSVK